MSVSEIAELLGVSDQSVYNWIARFRSSRDSSVLSDAPRLRYRSPIPFRGLDQ